MYKTKRKIWYILAKPILNGQIHEIKISIRFLPAVHFSSGLMQITQRSVRKIICSSKLGVTSNRSLILFGSVDSRYYNTLIVSDKYKLFSLN